MANPYHADICLPALALEDRDIRKEHANALAAIAAWRAKPATEPPGTQPAPKVEPPIA